MERVLVAVVLNVICGTGLAAADTVALLQESLRVREEAPSANDWWIFSRHRRSKEQNQEEGLLPGPIRETSMDSFGSAENLSDENEEEEEEQEEEEEEVWLARKPGTKKKGKKESAGQKGEDKKKEAKKESADQKGEDLKKKEAKKESAVQKSEDPKKEAKKESAGQKGEDSKKEVKKESAGQKVEDTKKEAKKPTEAPTKKEGTEAKKPTEAPTKKEGTEVTSDTADQSFKIGDWVQVLDTSTGTWKDCKITSPGRWPKTWDLHFPRTVGNMKDVPAHFVRRPPAPSQTPTPAAQPAAAKATQPAAAKATQPATAQAAQPAAQVPLAPASASAAVARPNASAGEIPFGPYNPYRYKVGDTMEVQTQTNGRWVPCKIMKKGKDDDKYDLHIPMAPPGQRDIKNVPSAALRPYDSAEYERLESMMGRSDVNYGDILGRMATSEKTYAEGERADVKVSTGEFKGQYVPCEVLGQGSSPTTYQIRVGQQEYSVPYYDLRKIAAPKSSASTDSSEMEEAEQPEQPEQPETPQPAEAEQPAQPEATKPAEVEQPVQPETQKPAEATSVEAPASPLPHFAPGDAAEVLVKDGPHRGTWIKVSITELGNKPDTYNIDTGSAKFSNVPASTLRAVDQSTAWDI